MVDRLPPSDPNAWTDEEWLAWLRETDAEAAGDDASGGAREEGATELRPPAPGRRSGSVIGNAMVGLAHAMYGRQEPEVVIMVDAPGDPPGEGERLDVQLDEEHPERSRVFRRRRTPPR